jgi:hypothetical protein
VALRWDAVERFAGGAFLATPLLAFDRDGPIDALRFAVRFAAADARFAKIPPGSGREFVNAIAILATLAPQSPDTVQLDRINSRSL